MTASSNNQRHPWGEIIKTDQDQPLRLGVVIYDAAKGDAHRYHASEQSLVEYAMPESGEKRTVELEMWLQQGCPTGEAVREADEGAAELL